MNPNSNKKFLTVLVVLLLVANVCAIALFWFQKEKSPQQLTGGPAKFIIKELDLDKKQQEQYLTLVEEHQQGVKPIKQEIKKAKDNFFSLLHKPKTTESEKIAAAKVVSSYTEKLDLLTLNHFAKVRSICNASQQHKFDGIIKQVTQMMGEKGRRKEPPHGPPGFEPHHPDRPPPPHEEGDFAPPEN